MKRYKYLFLELGWFLPVIIGQWLFAPHILRSKWKAIPLIAVPAAIYLTLRDRVALRDGTWTISEDSSTGVHIAGVPIEEAIFFLLTSWVSVQGVILLSDERAPGKLTRFRTRLQSRRSYRHTDRP